MKAASLLAIGAGIAATVALVAYFGAGGVVEALVTVGFLGFAAVCLIHLALIAVMGIAWRCLLPGVRCWVPIWARLIRNSASDMLPLSQVGGYVVGVRAMTLVGVPTAQAAAAMIVDVTLEFAAQIAYTALGLLWLLHMRPESGAALPVAVGLTVSVLAAVGFFAVQRRGIAHVQRIVRFFGRGWAERAALGAAALHAALADTYRQRAGVTANAALHLACWIAGTAEAWLVLRLAGTPLPFATVLVIESLLYAARSAAFFVPGAVGVQEGAYVVLGSAFGLGADTALALSLLKRARDLVIEVPALGIWQAIEGGKLWRRTGATPRTGAAAAGMTAAPPE